MSKTKTKDKTYFEKYDLYSDANPKDTIRIKYKTLDDVKDTIKKLERLYKQGEYTHSRISQVVNVMTQRLRVIDKTKGKPLKPNESKSGALEDARYKLSNKYFDFLKNRTREKKEDRKKLIFNI